MSSKIFITFLILFSTNLFAASFEKLMVSPGDRVNSISLESYANMWWQWTYTMPKEISPVIDTTGEYCHVGQTGDVWFLAGGYGSSTIKRTCTVPAGKYIFFPVINMVYFPSHEGSLSCQEAKAYAALNNDELLSIEVELNSLVSLNPAQSRLASKECFDLLGLVHEEFQAPKVFPSATDGFWIMLKPLPKGEHTLKFNAQYNRDRGPESKMAQNIEYKLIVE